MKIFLKSKSNVNKFLNGISRINLDINTNFKSLKIAKNQFNLHSFTKFNFASNLKNLLKERIPNKIQDEKDKYPAENENLESLLNELEIGTEKPKESNFLINQKGTHT